MKHGTITTRNTVDYITDEGMSSRVLSILEVVHIAGFVVL